MAVQTQIQTRRGTAASWTSTNPTLAAGEFGYETDTGKFKIGNGSTAWASLAYTAAATAVTYLFNATSGQTTFSGADANGLTLAYTVGAEQVYLNGVLQVRGSDYTATNGTSIVLASGALTSDVLNVIAYSAMTITDTYTQAQADAKFFQTANAFLAGKNKIINGDFGIWQRGTSFGIDQYTADRWIQASSGATATVTRQSFTTGQTDVPNNPNYFLRMDVTTGDNGCRISQYIENVATFANQTITISFYAKGTNPASGSLEVYLSQNFGGGGSSPVATLAGSIVLTSSWQRFTKTVAVPSISGKTVGTSSYLSVQIQQPPADTGTAAWTLDLSNVQVEAGSIATPFQTATGTLAGELAACQRYYYRATFATATSRLGVGYAVSTTSGQIAIPFPVKMRISPSALEQSGTPGDYSFAVASGTAAATAGPFFEYGEPVQGVIRMTTAGGLTAGQAAMFRNVNTDAYLGWSAEL